MYTEQSAAFTHNFTFLRPILFHYVAVRQLYWHVTLYFCCTLGLERCYINKVVIIITLDYLFVIGSLANTYRAGNDRKGRTGFQKWATVWLSPSDMELADERKKTGPERFSDLFASVLHLHYRWMMDPPPGYILLTGNGQFNLVWKIERETIPQILPKC